MARQPARNRRSSSGAAAPAHASSRTTTSGIGATPKTTRRYGVAAQDGVDACRPCTPVGDCNNPCGPCELCIGRDTLPPECTPSPDAGVPPDGAIPDGGVEYRCDPGVTPCGLPGEADCPVDFYCVTGCCVPTLI